jgi:hypothetical protein
LIFNIGNFGRNSSNFINNSAEMKGKFTSFYQHLIKYSHNPKESTNGFGVVVGEPGNVDAAGVVGIPMILSFTLCLKWKNFIKSQVMIFAKNIIQAFNLIFNIGNLSRNSNNLINQTCESWNRNRIRWDRISNIWHTWNCWFSEFILYPEFKFILN